MRNISRAMPTAISSDIRGYVYYTLVLDHGGTVVAVLYTEAECGALQSVLLVQRQQHGDKARADGVPGENQ